MRVALLLPTGSTVRIMSQIHLMEWEDRLQQLGVRYIKIWN